MKVLLLSTQFPLPARDGASLRVFNLLQQLSRSHQVTLLSLANEVPSPEHLTVLNSFCKVVTILHRRSKARRAWELLASFFWRDPYLVRIYWNEQFAAAVRELAVDSDLVQAEFPYGGQYLAGLEQIKVLDQHNVESSIVAANAEFATKLQSRVFFRLQAAKMMRYEQSLCSKVDLVLTTSAEDETTLAPYCRQTSVIPNGIHLGESGKENAGTVTFTGLMSYVANIDAMQYFCREIWPLVNTPERHLWIVGKGVGPETAELARDSITVTGEVPEVAPYLKATSVFIAPLRIGSGTRIKILDAMAHGLPVVSTSVGCAGLQVRHNENILIADTPDEFAAAVNLLLNNQGERHRLGSAGFQLVKKKYTWDAIGSHLQSVYSAWQSVLSAQ